ncbi:MAG: hypothetical protein ACYC92_02585, partial [Candidatus Acidiferrales bacterium]
PPFLPLRGNRSLQKPKENADSSSRLLVGMTTNRVFQQAAKAACISVPRELRGTGSQIPTPRLPPEGGPDFYRIYKKLFVRNISLDRPLKVSFVNRGKP